METRTTQEILGDIGHRLRRERMNQNLTQDMLAELSGLRQATISRVERGHDFNMETLLVILRALGRLQAIDAFLPLPAVSPIQLVERGGSEAQRVRPRRSDPAAPWQWNDQVE